MIISLVGTKGGVGKTTLALHLATEWLDRGRRVVVVDTTKHSGAMQWCERLDPKPQNGPRVVRWDSTQRTSLRSLAARHDLVLVDCDTHAQETQREILMASDLALVPTGPTPLDVWGLYRTAAEIQKLHSVRPELEVRIVLTRCLARTTLNNDMSKLIDFVPFPRLETTIGLRVEYQRAPATGLGVTGVSPNSRAADEIRKLVDEVDVLMRSQRGVRPPIEVTRPPLAVTRPPGSERWGLGQWREWEKQTVYKPVHS